MLVVYPVLRVAVYEVAQSALCILHADEGTGYCYALALAAAQLNDGKAYEILDFRWVVFAPAVSRKGRK